MNNENSKYISVEELTDCGSLIKEISYKPKTAPYVCAGLAAVLLITMNWIAIILGIFIIAFILFVTFKIEDYRTLTIYDQCIVVYDRKNLDLARKITYDEVEEWTVKSAEGITDALMLKLKDGDVIYKDTFQTSDVYKALKKIIPMKETREVRAEKNRQKKVKFRFKLPSFDFLKKK